MKTKPILFSTPMVKAILKDQKTQTRRIIKPQPRALDEKSYVFKKNKNSIFSGPFSKISEDFMGIANLAKYKNGDILWVRETFLVSDPVKKRYSYKADWSEGVLTVPKNKGIWTPSIFMPKEACRIFLEVTNVRVERLNDLSESDAIAEGVEPIGRDPKTHRVTRYKGYPVDLGFFINARKSFCTLWKSINGEESWEQNPWVWVYDFKRVERPENFLNQKLKK